jgi:hypothetical protein
MGDLIHHDLTVGMDYGSFVLRGSAEAMEDADDEALFDVATAGDGVAADGSTILVLCRHQNNFAMPLRVEVWDREPDDDVVGWDDAFEAGLEVGADGELWYESPTLPPVHCVVPPGTYRVRVAGRGIHTAGWPGSTTPGDSWRVQLWPATGPVAARRIGRPAAGRHRP